MWINVADWRVGIRWLAAIVAVPLCVALGCSEEPIVAEEGPPAQSATGRFAVPLVGLEPHQPSMALGGGPRLYNVFGAGYGYQVAREGARWAVVATTACDLNESTCRCDIAFGERDEVLDIVSDVSLPGRPRGVVLDPATGLPAVFYVVGTVGVDMSHIATTVEAVTIGGTQPPRPFSLGSDAAIEAVLPLTPDGGFALVTRERPQTVHGAGWCREGQVGPEDPEYRTCPKRALVKSLEGFGSKAGIATTFGLGPDAEYGASYAITRSGLARWGKSFLAVSDVNLMPLPRHRFSGPGNGTMVGRFSSEGALEAFRLLWLDGTLPPIQGITAIDEDHVQVLRQEKIYPLAIGVWILDRSLSIVGHRIIKTEQGGYYGGVPFSASLGRGGVASLVPGYAIDKPPDLLEFQVGPSLLGEPWSATALDGVPGQVPSLGHYETEVQMVGALGDAATDASGAAILAVESGDATLVLLTDRWGRVEVPKNDPCGGDGDESCSDGDPTTIDRCTEAGCQHVAKGESDTP